MASMRLLQSKATAATDIACYSTAVYTLQAAHGREWAPRCRPPDSATLPGPLHAIIPSQELFQFRCERLAESWPARTPGRSQGDARELGCERISSCNVDLHRHERGADDGFVYDDDDVYYDDEKRKRILDVGSVKALMGMLETASDDDTRREALTTLATLAHYDPTVDAMHKAGGLPLVNALSKSATDSIIVEHCTALLAKLDQRATNKV